MTSAKNKANFQKLKINEILHWISLPTCKLLFCVTVVSLVPEVVVWSFPSSGCCQLKSPVKITWSLFSHNPPISSIEGLA